MTSHKKNSLNPLTVRVKAPGEINYGKLFLTSKNPEHIQSLL